MGDDIRMVNSIGPRTGQFFGYPYICGKTELPKTATTRCAAGEYCGPTGPYDAHAADLGLLLGAKQFPAKYQADSSRRSTDRGTAQAGRSSCDVTSLKSDGTADKTEVFADVGSTMPRERIAAGRSTFAVMKDGSLLVSDDFAVLLQDLLSAVRRALAIRCRCHGPGRATGGNVLAQTLPLARASLCPAKLHGLQAFRSCPTRRICRATAGVS